MQTELGIDHISELDHDGNWKRNEKHVDAQTRAIEERMKDNKRRLGKVVDVEETIPTLAGM